MIVAIIGTRWPEDERTFEPTTEAGRKAKAAVRQFIARLPPEDDIVSGDAAGVDSWAWDAAYNLRQFIRIKPAWTRDGHAGGPRRNATIAKIADRMVAFWDGKSRGTKSAIEEMQKLGKPVVIVKFMDPPTG